MQRHLDILNAFRAKDRKRYIELYEDLPYDDVDGYHEVENVNSFMTDIIYRGESNNTNPKFYYAEISNINVTID